MKTYTVYSAAPGETWLLNWNPVTTIKARGPLDAAIRYLGAGNFRRLAICRFTNDVCDFIFSR
jgi:hypothetical protein